MSFVSGDNCVAEDSAEDRAVLVELYNATDGANWTNNTNWLSDEPMREWHGVVTARCHSMMPGRGDTDVNLPTDRATSSRNQLTGEIPTELGNLSNLTRWSSTATS